MGPDESYRGIVTTATFRFYEELNDFLSAPRQQVSFESPCAESATIKQAIEALGVPHTEIEVILVNGASVDFSHRVAEGDRISVYPVFEAIDVHPILRLRAEPLRVTRFVVDAHLGRLTRYLRMLGFDSLYEKASPDRELVRVSLEERRVLLTRDRELLMHRDLTHGIYVRGVRPRAQLAYVLGRLDLGESCRPFTRCMACNEELQPVDRKTVIDRIPVRVAERYDDYRLCPSCGRVYWRGTHWERMQTFVTDTLDDRS
jgi:uncharacterized protein with PIN domain/sulfur carrier protein ThiS